MQISELFYSIQGEGKRTGNPSFFIRTNNCNLRCRFPGGNYCDTPYTSWFPDDNQNLGDIEISKILSEYSKFGCRDIVITGGEPSIYSGQLEELCIELKKYNKDSFITLETNGTFTGDFIKYTDLASISPKLKSSVPFNTEFEKTHVKNRINLNVLKNYSLLKENNLIDIQWKFVFTSEADLKEIKELQTNAGISDKDIYLMPEGITEEDLRKNRLQTIEACLKYGYNYTDRIHIIAWGNKRGV